MNEHPAMDAREAETEPAGDLDRYQLQQFRERARDLERALLEFHLTYARDSNVAKHIGACLEQIEDSLRLLLCCADGGRRYTIARSFLGSERAKIEDLNVQLAQTRHDLLSLVNRCKREMNWPLSEAERAQIAADIDAGMEAHDLGVVSRAVDVLVGHNVDCELSREADRLRALARHEAAVEEFISYALSFAICPKRSISASETTDRARLRGLSLTPSRRSWRTLGDLGKGAAVAQVNSSLARLRPLMRARPSLP